MLPITVRVASELKRLGFDGGLTMPFLLDGDAETLSQPMNYHDGLTIFSLVQIFVGSALM